LIERSAERDAAVRSALPHVPRLGWTEAALEAGLRGIGAEPRAHRWLLPRGPVEAVEVWVDLSDRRMAAAAAAEGIDGLRTPARIRRLIALRLEAAGPYREALRRALALTTLPWHAGTGARILARTVDAMWIAAGDTSSGPSRHTRRASLAGVYAATLSFWLREPENLDDALGFLDRRLANIARLGRARS